jgi:NAD(P)-dependent dehydrogenase (short-subunit alcohol dehydrogenase family)
MLRTAVITGAAQGIGRRTAEVLAERDYAVAVNDVRPPAETLAAVRQRGGDALEFVGDISHDETAAAFAEAVLARWGHVDVLVNNAGISHICAAEDTTPQDFRRVIEVNLVAPFLLARVFGRHMLERRAGSIVNVASIAGISGVADRIAYNASKHGLVGLTRTLAAEWGGRGVRVNAVCPGWVKTAMDDADQARGTYSDDDITGRIPLNRFATPDDIALAIAFLADPAQSGFVNGHTLVVDGGWTADASWQSLRAATRER